MKRVLLFLVVITGNTHAEIKATMPKIATFENPLSHGTLCQDPVAADISPALNKLTLKFATGPIVVESSSPSARQSCTVLTELTHEPGWSFTIERIYYPAKVIHELPNGVLGGVQLRAGLRGISLVEKSLADRTLVPRSTPLNDLSSRHEKSGESEPMSFDFKFNGLEDFTPCSKSRHVFQVHYTPFISDRRSVREKGNSDSDKLRLTVTPIETLLNSEEEHAVHFYIKWRHCL